MESFAGFLCGSGHIIFIIKMLGKLNWEGALIEPWCHPVPSMSQNDNFCVLVTPTAPYHSGFPIKQTVFSSSFYRLNKAHLAAQRDTGPTLQIVPSSSSERLYPKRWPSHNKPVGKIISEMAVISAIAEDYRVFFSTWLLLVPILYLIRNVRTPRSTVSEYTSLYFICRQSMTYMVLGTFLDLRFLVTPTSGPFCKRVSTDIPGQFMNSTRKTATLFASPRTM